MEMHNKKSSNRNISLSTMINENMIDSYKHLMNIWQISFDKHVYLEAKDLEFFVLKSEQFVILKVNQNADHHPEGLFFS